MAAPMVSHSGDSLVVRSGVSSTALFSEGDDDIHANTSSTPTTAGTTPSSSILFNNDAESRKLPQCKIKRSYMCPRCTFYTQNPRVYLYHLKSVHDEKIKVFECPHCLYASKHSQKLQRHVTMVHAPGKRVAKPRAPSSPSKPKSKPPPKLVPPLLQPGKTPPQPGETNSEIRLDMDDFNDEKIIPERIEEVIVCTEEEVAMESAAQQNGIGTYLCSVCSFTSRSESLLTRHERIVHFKKKIFRCTRCSYVTNLKSRFTKHVKYHTMPLIKCGQCDFKTAYKWNLDRHHRNHGGPGAFHCTVCNFAADIKQSLTVHEMNHHVPTSSIGATVQGIISRRRFNKVGGSDCALETEEDAIDAEELELLRLEREDTPAPLEGDSSANARKKDDAAGTTTKRKPLPPLIPLQSKASKPAKTPPLGEWDLNEICDKSCPTSTFKDFVPAIGDADAFKSKEGLKEEEKKAKTASPPASPLHTKLNGRSAAAGASPKKTFFEKLKEKLASDGQAGLVCATCGLEARCLSELVLHQQQQHRQQRDASNPAAAKTLQGSSGSRCSHCRHRCKSSADLVQHLKGCAKALQNQSGADGEVSQDAEDTVTSQPPLPQPDPAAAHPMENKVFVWNMPSSGPASVSGSGDRDSAEESSSSCEGNDEDSSLLLSDSTLVKLTGIETAPGYGSVNPEKGAEQDLTALSDTTDPANIKRVFKCPHCSFWASTASRFHVHIVGHLNKKPFECSICAYRSNWRWDITKHIRLKSARDPSHERARLLMIDETGRRNYSKYNKHLTLMRVTEQKMDPAPGTRQSKAAASGQQGNVAPGSPEPIPILPAPPKLTRAPAPRTSVRSAPTTSAPVLRPPPPLQAASHVFIVNPVTGLREKQDQPSVQSLKRPADSQESVTEPKRPNTDNKKTVWRCKQCHFRDGDRSVVLAHVKGHYRQANTEAERPNGGKQGERKAPSSSTVAKQKEDRNTLQATQDKKSAPPLWEPNGVHSCESCKFTTNSLQTLAAHAEFHKPHVDAIFKCYFCPYYVQTKEELLQHMVVHGVSQDEEFVQKTVMIKVTSPITSPPATPALQPQGGASEPPSQSDTHSPLPPTFESSTTPSKGADGPESDGSGNKRYRCNGCPYVSNSKSQYLYHKQFHRSRGAVFKCTMCSYNVSRRHLLHQHLKVHGIDDSASSLTGDKEATPGMEAMDVDRDAPADKRSIDTTDLKDIPVCWVLRNKKLLKMFKCRFCPHVNLRRANIQDHERMHTDRPARPWETIQPHQRLTCEFCSYTCNNAGVLSSHSKVHQDEYPRLCAIVDPNRKDKDQIRELNQKLKLGLDSSERNEPEAESPANAEDDINENAINIRSLLKTTGGVKDAMLEDHDEKEVDEKRQSDRVTRRAVDNAKEETMVLFCQSCPARFLFAKELGIHSRFHSVKLAHHCHSCSYTARHSAHLRAHLKVHTQEYHERTEALLKMYPVHSDYPMPLHTCLKDGFDKMWVVPSDEIADNTALSLTKASSGGDVEARLGDSTSEGTDPNDPAAKTKYSCTKCPATFFKSVALQYHLTLHGANHPHKCRVCDYAVKTYGNLAKHENIHGPREKLKRFHRDLQGGKGVFVSGLEVHVADPPVVRKTGEKSELDADSSANDLLDESDPIDENPYNGSPDFVYPTYLTKNGRVKEKRFKCVKCPSAFEKREQFRVHLSLHGSNQRYSCSKCDYSVKYYANFVQHEQKHVKSEQAKAESEFGSLDKMAPTDEGEALDEESEGMPSPDKAARQSAMAGSPQRSMKTINRGPLALSMADRQTMMVLQQRRASGALNSRPSDKSHRCQYCPYSSCRRDSFDSHMRRHIILSGVRSVYTCEYCDYTVPTQHFLREHTKVHFASDKLPRPDTFMTCEKLELWVGNENQEKHLIFQDKGRNVEDRFAPVVDMDGADAAKKVFVNPNTGETITCHSNGDAQPDWDSCSEGTNKSEVVAATRNGPVAPSQSSMTTDDASDTASSTRCSSRSSAGSDIDDDPVSRSHAASVPNAPTDVQVEPTLCLVDPANSEV